MQTLLMVDELSVLIKTGMSFSIFASNVYLAMIIKDNKNEDLNID
jgi:hypothetical protein